MKAFLKFIAPAALVFIGLGIGLASLAEQSVAVYSTSYGGTLAPGNNTTVALPFAAVAYLSINLTTASCNVRLYPMTADQWAAYNTTGQLSDTWIGCANATATVAGPVDDLVLVNLGTTAAAWSVRADAFSIETPYAVMSIPGAALALSGLILFVPAYTLRRAQHLKQELDRDFGGEEKEK